MALRVLDLVPFKQDSPYSTALLRHYVERSGTPYDLGELPQVWQDWIYKQTSGHVGTYKNLNPYNAGIYDLQNSLGHFNVRVTAVDQRVRTYEISDTYEFGFTHHDRRQQGRHGFPLGKLSPFELESIRRLLPKTTYHNPGGFTEGWEVKKLGKETVLLIPQQFLVQQGKAFKVTGKFVR